MTIVEYCNSCQQVIMACDLAQQKQAPSTRYELFSLARNEITKLMDYCVEEMRGDDED